MKKKPVWPGISIARLERQTVVETGYGRGLIRVLDIPVDTQIKIDISIIFFLKYGCRRALMITPDFRSETNDLFCEELS
ncbi:MAG TPA: hypothetical protein VM008_18660 [Phycisphaerae bacterium]|nr:hypothetical protein [Phycisphaerae bacterium]